MDQEPSFMKVIDNFDRCLKGDITEEARTYCEAMKKIFIGIEQTNVNLQKTLREIKGKIQLDN